MPKARTPVMDIDKKVRAGEKQFVRYKEGAALYSMGLHTFETIAMEAGAVYHIKGVVLVNTSLVNEYLENFRDEIKT